MIRTKIASTAQGHEINSPDRAAVAHKFRFEDHCVVAITLAVLTDRYRRSKNPAPVLVITHQSRETGVRIKTRRAEPVDGPAARHERTGMCISNQPIIFDSGCHVFLLFFLGEKSAN